MKVFLIGNAHIDPVWLWQWQEGYHEVMATFRSALDRMNEFDSYIFTCACTQYYRWVETSDPEMFEEIRARVKEGRWVLAGGMWIQPDMNTPSGESFARQLLYSQRYFLEKFGRIAQFGYNVDSFGHNASTPMILNAAGIDEYVWMRPGTHENAAIPQGPMLWESADGSRVYAYRIHGEYVCMRETPKKIREHIAFGDLLCKPTMCFYGVGNHGGGPTVANLNEIEEFLHSDPLADEVRYASPEDYFEELKKNNIELAVWRNELQHHASGCYSTHSASKKKHRQTENALLRVETLGTLSRVLTGHTVNAAAVKQAWEDLMFNQFHDIMGGCCLREALDDVDMQLGEALSIAVREEAAALQAISWRIDTSRGNMPLRSKENDLSLWGNKELGTPVIVFNPHAFPAPARVHVPRPITAVQDCDGNAIPCQRIRASRTNGADRYDGLFEIMVPPLGYTTCWVYLEEQAAETGSPLTITKTSIENDHLRVEFDEMTGSMIHLYDKASGHDALTTPSRTIMADIEHCDTWAHNIFRFDKECEMYGEPSFRIVETGPVRAVLEVTQHCGASTLRIRYALYSDAKQLEMDIQLDLHAAFRMVKLCYPTSVQTSYSEIPFGYLERNANGDEEHCQRWIAAQGERGGLALLNDGKYSYSCTNDELRLTIANSSYFADHYGQSYRDEDNVAMDQGVQAFRCALVPYAGTIEPSKLSRAAAILNRPLPHVNETYHFGPLPTRYGGIHVPDAISVTALKRSEDDNGYVLRLLNLTESAQNTNVTLDLLSRDLSVNIPARGLRTYFVPDDSTADVKDILLTELSEFRK